MGLFTRLRRLIIDERTLYDVYLENNKIPEDLVVKDSQGREYITGSLEVVCSDVVGINLHPVADQDNRLTIPASPKELRKYIVLPGS